MSGKIKADFYIRRKSKLLALFQEDLKVAKQLLLEKFDEKKTETLLADIIKEFENILLEAQYVGGNKNPFTQFLTGAVGTFATIRIMAIIIFIYQTLILLSSQFSSTDS